MDPVSAGSSSFNHPTPHERYLTELLTEKQNLQPFEHILPQCTMLLIQEIARVTMASQFILDRQRRGEPDSPLRAISQQPIDLDGRRALPLEAFTFLASIHRPPPNRGNIPLPPPLPPIARPTFSRLRQPSFTDPVHAPLPPPQTPSRVTTHSLIERPNMHQN